jgi:hypothetical protein
MPTDRLPLGRPIRGALTIDQVQELWLGPSHNFGSLFSDEDAVRAAWERHKDWLLREFGSHGKRPLAWYYFERPDVPLSDDHESSTLWAHGVLGNAEKAELEAWWKTEFENAYALGYDAIRRRRHLDWADVPLELRKRWRAQRRRAAGTIKKPAVEASEAPSAAPVPPT